MTRQTVEEAFADHRKAQLIRKAIAYVKAWTRIGDDQEMQWAAGEVLDAAEKYANYLEMRAYTGDSE